ncbi:MAG: endonuclease III [Deltaproteobacteria bacterium SG8_13]|nr:MAG: endonuclease III [Deltaproteobacteria bacterium SG8_13]
MTLNLRRRADRVRKTLRSLYPEVKPQLFYRNPFELLVATILSAQCTDQQVNRVTPTLFEELRSPRDFAHAPRRRIEELVRPTGFYRNKAKSIQNCAVALLENHAGEVPDNLEKLVQLPGVGRKTANVVLGAAFNKPGIVVDTHVGRISRRLELTRNGDPVKVELDLMHIVPRRDWSDFSLRLIFFGRQFCTARKPKCPDCPLKRLCPFPDKTPG